MFKKNCHIASLSHHYLKVIQPTVSPIPSKLRNVCPSSIQLYGTKFRPSLVNKCRLKEGNDLVPNMVKTFARCM